MVWTVLMLIVLIAFMSFALDWLYMVWAAQQLQVGADAASLAGAQVVQVDQDAARADAVTYAGANTVVGQAIQIRSNAGNQADGDVVVGVFDRETQVFTPTTTSPNAVQVRARRNEGSLGGSLPLLFSPVIGVNAVNLERTAIALAITEGTGLGIVMLQPSGPDALQHSGNGSISVAGPIIVNSSSSQALQQSGNGDLTATSFQITGNYQQSGGGSMNGPIETGVAPTPDPLASLPVPNHNDYTVRSTEPFQVSGRATLQPGVYIGGIDISTNRTVTMNPGIYIMRGKGFKVSGNLTLNANEVMLYNADGPSDDADQILFSSDSRVNWTPPTSGPWKGVAMFQQRNVSDKKLQISGNGNTNITGIIYAAGAEVQLSGNGGVAFLGGAFVARSMQISGDSSVNIGDPSGAGSGETTVFLVH